MKLHITLQAGKAPGTTDYVIQAQELPHRDTWSLYADHAGSETTGRWRQGIFYMNRSLTGRRDTLTLSGLHAKGLDSFSAGYELPISRRGTRLALDYSTNSTEVVDGFYKEWDIPVKGRASYLSATLTQPLAVSTRAKTEASLAFSQTHSRTDILDEPIIDDTFRDVTAALTRTNYGSRWALYRKYAFTHGSWDSDSEFQFRPNATYNIFDVTGIYQRGASLYTFLDAGKIWGEQIEDQLMENTTLLGTGLGLRARLWDGATLDTALGIPLKKTAGSDDVASSQLHLTFVASF